MLLVVGNVNGCLLVILTHYEERNYLKLACSSRINALKSLSRPCLQFNKMTKKNGLNENKVKSAQH